MTSWSFGRVPARALNSENASARSIVIGRHFASSSYAQTSSACPAVTARRASSVRIRSTGALFAYLLGLPMLLSSDTCRLTTVRRQVTVYEHFDRDFATLRDFLADSESDPLRDFEVGVTGKIQEDIDLLMIGRREAGCLL